jgi:serine phosphatase RsbU (regulator of sigma subunit)/anti-sigma regulatory factor (Ser/Thr protein kinase)
MPEWLRGKKKRVVITLFTYIFSRAGLRPGQPRKRISRARQRWYAVLRYVDSVSVVGGLFGLTIALFHSDFLFILLPTSLSIVVAFILARSYLATLKALFFTTLVALLFFSGVTGLELVTHQVTESKAVLVTTTLAIAVMFAPLAFVSLRLLDQRFHLRDDATSRTVEGFTASLREEIALDSVRARLFDVIQKTLQPQFVSLWVLARAQASPESAEGAEGAEGASEPIHPSLPPEAPELSAVAATIPASDPLVEYVLKRSGAIELERVQVESPALQTLQANGAELALPLVSQGELMSLLVLGPRLDGLEYTREDRSLLATLAAQVAPALRVGQLVRAEQAQVRERARIEQELRTARVIQQTFLPKVIPSLAGWQLATCYQPAREVGGDFYDFLHFEDGRLGIVLGDVTDKGIPAALVMTATRTMLRTASQQDSSPGAVFARVNDLLSDDIPPGMFVTCFYAILDPATGHLRFANAGQDWPYLRHADGRVAELHVSGMPLGLLPGSRYEEGEATLSSGDTLLFFSDGLVEAHNAGREMFGLSRLAGVVAAFASGPTLIDAALDALAAFTGAGWEQEDDITLVTLTRYESSGGGMDSTTPAHEPAANHDGDTDTAGDDATTDWRSLDAWTLASEPGNERAAIARVAQLVRDHALPLSPARLERLQTAVGEATMNAMEHGNAFVPERLVDIVVCASSSALSVQITDQGSHAPIPAPQTPDLEAKLAGLQSPRGWGLFLIKELVDDLRVSGDAHHHTVELIMALDSPS